MGQGGAIVNIASVSGLRGSVGRAAYGASKGGVITLSQVMAVELAPLGIRVNVIAPGPIDTPLVQRLHDNEVRDAYHRLVPMARYGTPAEIAGAALYLCGPDAAYITGHVLAVDGGFLAAGLRR
jgi:NAD(P)-dependent dehydrogenase (short-subunit alcohol dehydrogenase family)